MIVFTSAGTHVSVTLGRIILCCYKGKSGQEEHIAATCVPACGCLNWFQARLAILESKLAGGSGAASNADLQALRATLVEARNGAAQVRASSLLMHSS